MKFWYYYCLPRYCTYMQILQDNKLTKLETNSGLRICIVLTTWNMSTSSSIFIFSKTRLSATKIPLLLHPSLKINILLTLKYTITWMPNKKLNNILPFLYTELQNCRYFTIKKDPVYSSRTPVSIKHLVS
jgi:hypothetical protein